MKIKLLLIATFLSVINSGARAMDYLGFVLPTRYYDAAEGRFISPDAVVQAPDDPQNLNRYGYVKNNPMIYTDPTGNTWKLDNIWNKIGDLLMAVFSQPSRQPHSDTGENRPRSPAEPSLPGMPTQPNSDLRSIIAIQQTPILLSGPATVLTWGILDSLSDSLLNSEDYEKFASGIFGHRTSDKERKALASVVGIGASYVYHRIAGYQPKTYKGRGYAEKENLDGGIDGFNNIGNAHMGPPRTFFDEGNSFSRFDNNVFGVNAVGGVHDQFQVQLEQNWGAGARSTWNVPGMPVAAAITYPALIWQPTWLFEEELRDYR